MRTLQEYKECGLKAKGLEVSYYGFASRNRRMVCKEVVNWRQLVRLVESSSSLPWKDFDYTFLRLDNSDEQYDGFNYTTILYLFFV